MIAVQKPTTASELAPRTAKAAPFSPFQSIATSSSNIARIVGTPRTIKAVAARPADTSSDSRLAPINSTAPAMERMTIAQ